jgi:hypothetical protein
MSSKINQYEWIILDVPQWAEDRAIEHRKRRDEIYGNIYGEESTDERWVGDLGEYVFKSFLNSRNVDKATSKWILDEAAGKADFILGGGFLVDVKTVKRKVAVKPSYTAQITAQHINERVHHYFFMSYQPSVRKMTLLGGISKEEFKKSAIYYGEGEQVHQDYIIRSGHEIYNIEVTKLIPPDRWLTQVLAEIS